MAFEAKVASFTSLASVGNQPITGVGFQPKFLLFWFNRRGVDGSQGDAIFGVGAAISSTDVRSAGNYAGNNLTSSNNAAWNQSTSCIYAAGGSPAATLVSMDADGFTLNWTNANAMIVNYLALGGSDLTNVKGGIATAKTSLGTQAYTGVGFQPTCLLVFAGKFAGEPLDAGTQGNALFGFATGPTQRGFVAWRNQHTQNPQIAKHRQSKTRLVSHTTDFTEADFVSFDADGFTLNYTLAGGASDKFYYIALRGPSFKVSAFNQPAGTGNQALTGAGFLPKAALMLSGNDLSANNDVTQPHARVSLGVATGTSERGCIWAGESDAVSPTVAHRNLDRTKLLKLMTEGATPTVNGAIDHVSFDTDGQTIDWTTNDGVAREILVLWMGDQAPTSPALGSIPPPMFMSY